LFTVAQDSPKEIFKVTETLSRTAFIASNYLRWSLQFLPDKDEVPGSNPGSPTKRKCLQDVKSPDESFSSGDFFEQSRWQLMNVALCCR
jgi:hypothetical protein